MTTHWLQKTTSVYIFPKSLVRKIDAKRGWMEHFFFLSQQLLTIVTLNTKWHEKNVRDEKGFFFWRKREMGEKSLIGVSRSVCHTKYFIFYGVACKLDSFFEERWCFFVICDLLELLQQPLRQCSVTQRGSSSNVFGSGNTGGVHSRVINTLVLGLI